MKCLTNRFLLAKLQLDYILNAPTNRKKKAALESLPTTLLEAYTDVMKRIEKLQEWFKDLALKTLSWVLHAKRPLLMAELREAIAVEDTFTDLDEDDLTDPGILVENCAGFVVHEKSSGIVRLAHKTVAKFLKSQQQLSTPVGLAKTCLTYLSFDIFEEGPCKIKDLKYRLKRYRFSIYAAQFWGRHTIGQAEESPDIQKTVLRLFASENKKNSMLQLERYVNPSSDDFGFIEGQTLLHVIAKNGLATICEQILCRRINGNDTYVLEVDI